jgi:hypothetical protein
MTSRIDEGERAAWPRLDLPGGAETTQSLLLWAQILGKTRLGLSPMVNHWWQVPLYVSARGLSTSPIPIGDRIFDLELDFIAHRLVARTSDDRSESMSLCDQSLAGFYADYLALLARLGVSVQIHPLAVEMPERVRLDRDARVCRYDPDWANRFFRALIQADRVLKQFRGGFLGKASPVHFFWGGFDLAVTRFSGRGGRPGPLGPSRGGTPPGPALRRTPRARRLLRQLAGQTRDQARSPHAASGHPLVRARRGLGLLLSQRRVRGGAARVPRRASAPAFRSAVSAASSMAWDAFSASPSLFSDRPDRGCRPVWCTA